MNNAQILQILTLSACIFSTLCAIISIYLSINAQIELKAQKQSTHKLEYVPIDPAWGSSDKEIKELNEQSEAEFPDIDEDELTPDQIDLKKMI